MSEYLVGLVLSDCKKKGLNIVGGGNKRVLMFNGDSEIAYIYFDKGCMSFVVAKYDDGRGETLLCEKKSIDECLDFINSIKGEIK